MDNASNSACQTLDAHYTEGEKLGAEITELGSCIDAATYRSLVKIRE